MNKILSCLLALLGLGTACNVAHNADADEFGQLIAQTDVELLDVRTPEEFAQGHLHGARNLDIETENFADSALSLLSPWTRVAVYCRSGRRSARAAELLAQKGRRVTNLLGGIQAWEKANKPIARPGVGFDTLHTRSGKPVVIYPLMHASVRLTLGDCEVYVDPVAEFKGHAIDYQCLPTAHLVLVTHEHPDHLDETTINSLVNQWTNVCTNQRCDSLLGGKCHVMANGESMSMYDIDIEAVPAYNTTAGHLQYHPKGRDNGFVLTYDGLRIYIAGDTEDIAEMSELRDIDIAFLPCNQPFTMTIDQLVWAARVIKPRILYPYHCNGTDISALPKLLSRDGIEVRVRQFDMP